jgi:DNA-binding MarR family transcriptional regulator
VTTTAHAEIVDQILDQLSPLIARQRKALVQQGCFRQVSSTQLHVLYMLDVSLPNVTGIVERLVERGLVERIRPADDRRIVEVRITAAGREILDEIDLVKRQEMAKVIDRLTPVQQERALRAFTDLRIASEELAQETTHEFEGVPA